MIEFAAPAFGWLTLPLLLILLLRLRGERIRREQLRRLAEPHLLPGLVPYRVERRRFPIYLPVVVMLLLILALMRPQWGIVEGEQTTSGLDIVFAIDLSRSMLADDVSPSRLAMAKKAVAKTMESIRADRVGIIGFAGTAFLLCPLTSDHETAVRVVEELRPDTLPKGGSSIASALKEASRAFRATAAGGRVLVVLSDGEDHTGEVAQAATALNKDGITVIAEVTGTPSGALMPLGPGEFVKDAHGAVVKTSAQPATLQVLDHSASLLADPSLLTARIEQARTRLQETARKERRRTLAEQYTIPLAAALTIWLPAMFLGNRRDWP